MAFDCVALSDERQRAVLASMHGPRTGHMVGHLEHRQGFLLLVFNDFKAFQGISGHFRA